MDLLNYADSDSESDSSGPVVPSASLDRLGKRRRTSDVEDEPIDRAKTGKEVDEAVQPSLSKKPKKTLPKLTSTFQTAPVDDPSRHQGRTRARPWVQGEYPAHVYLELKMSKSFRKALKDLVAQTQGWIDAEAGPGKCIVHPIFEDEGVRGLSIGNGLEENDGPTAILPREGALKAGAEISDRTSDRETTSLPDAGQKRKTPSSNLHISLTHPLPLRKSQIPELLAHLRTHLGRTRNGAGIKVGLEGGFRAYTNGAQQDEQVKATGSGDFGVLDDLGRKGMGRKSRGFLALGVGVGHDGLRRLQEQTLHPFLKTHHLPLYHVDPEFHASFAWSLLIDGESPFNADLLRRVEESWGKEVRKLVKDGWDVGQVMVRVGKDVHRFDL